ncbi:MAG TPA: penicillin acylase family protein [Candidatus Heimdallarchaeota archaeon]|nr:penicillin acylase family protein [Candidatus Heimdallarchaeota archaeon]
MKVKHLYMSVIILGSLFISSAVFSLNQAGELQKESHRIKGLSQSVEIIRDRWGISHIYAQNQKDLFFAQGFNVARDRLFQLEVWRRQATGTLAEILGPKALNKDIGARLLKARVDMREEMNHYHPDGEEIITSFVRGINSYIDRTRENPSLLPIEFQLLGIKPGYWTPEVVISRHNGLFRNVRYEVAFAQTVNAIGSQKVKDLLYLQPKHPGLVPKEGLDLSLIKKNILETYLASRSPVDFGPEDIVDSSLRAKSSAPSPPKSPVKPLVFIPPSEQLAQDMYQGSNNWIIKGELTFSGSPILANDPHRSQQIPSLRYWVHLKAPGWNVIGGGEPCLPGISIGHNDHGAWGLTIFAIDQEDLYVYETNMLNPLQYRYQGNWEEMTVIQETIPVKGESPVTVDLKFTRHGPVLYEDKELKKAYALRAAWLEVGGAPYLASLRMDQAKNWEEFRNACSFSHTPSENMVWADVNNNIGWQAVGITPLRTNWAGLLPVPGDGSYEWNGYLPIKDLPHSFNPPEGFFATANQYNIPDGYPYSVGFIWTDPFRFSRLQEVLGSGRKFTMTDMMELQHDFLSLPARAFIPLLKGLTANAENVENARQKLLSWNCVMDSDSIEATIYQSWQRRLSQNVWNLYIPEEVREIFPIRSLKKMADLLCAPDGTFGPNPTDARDLLLIQSLEEAIQDIEDRLGPDQTHWRYGQEKFHHIQIKHLLSEAVNVGIRTTLDLGPEPRGGNDNTVNKTSSGFNQTSGASFRIIANLEDWDTSLGTNSPGQSGNSDSSHYSDLFRMWLKGKYFPIFFSRDKVQSAAELIMNLEPE